MLDPYGIEFTYEVKSMMMGKKGLEAIEIMLKHYNLENDPAEFYQNREEILDELFQDCDLMPGALRLVKHLKKHQIPMAIATSSHKRHFDLKTLKHKELFKEMFQAVITGDEVVHSKPNPEIFVKAAETLAGGEGYNPAHYLVRICCFGFLKKMKITNFTQLFDVFTLRTILTLPRLWKILRLASRDQFRLGCLWFGYMMSMNLLKILMPLSL